MPVFLFESPGVPTKRAPFDNCIGNKIAQSMDDPQDEHQDDATGRTCPTIQILLKCIITTITKSESRIRQVIYSTTFF